MQSEVELKNNKYVTFRFWSPIRTYVCMYVHTYSDTVVSATGTAANVVIVPLWTWLGMYVDDDVVDVVVGVIVPMFIWMYIDDVVDFVVLVIVPR
jgi:hypothetical protein